VLGLINACDAYVSLHRAEGFGRTLAEAMLLGKPVVATNYSGNVDFMQNELAHPVEFKLIKLDKSSYQWVDAEDRAVWADADLMSASKAVFNTAKERSIYKDMNKNINASFSPGVVSMSMLSSLK
jgi:glycosyltransferase involved in cell wall biosynthesis